MSRAAQNTLCCRGGHTDVVEGISGDFAQNSTKKRSLGMKIEYNRETFVSELAIKAFACKSTTVGMGIA